jgi:hypothetical protein
LSGCLRGRSLDEKGYVKIEFGDMKTCGKSHKDDEISKSVYLDVSKTMKKEASHKFDELMRRPLVI